MSQDLEQHEHLLELLRKAGEAMIETITYAHGAGIYIPKLATLATNTAEIAEEVAVKVSRLRGDLH